MNTTSTNCQKIIGQLQWILRSGSSNIDGISPINTRNRETSMRIRNITEGIRMGSSDLSTPSQKDYTIGFEFEITVDQDMADELEDFDYDPYEFDSDAYDAFVSNYDTTDQIAEWVYDNILRKGELQDFLDENDIEPRYGKLTDPEEILEFEQQRHDSALLSKYSEEEIDEITDLLLDIKEDPDFEYDEETIRTIMYWYSSVH